MVHKFVDKNNLWGKSPGRVKKYVDVRSGIADLLFENAGIDRYNVSGNYSKLLLFQDGSSFCGLRTTV